MINIKEEQISVCDYCSRPIDPYEDSMYVLYNDLQTLYCQSCADDNGHGPSKTWKWTITAGDKV